MLLFSPVRDFWPLRNVAARRHFGSAARPFLVCFCGRWAGARARDGCGAGDERDLRMSPPVHARPRCVDGRPAFVQGRFFRFYFFGGALIDHAAGDRDPAWASLGFRGLRRKLSSGSAFPEPPLAGDGLSGPLWVRAAGGDESWAPQCLTSDPSALPVPYQCLTQCLTSRTLWIYTPGASDAPNQFSDLAGGEELFCVSEAPGM